MTDPTLDPHPPENDSVEVHDSGTVVDPSTIAGTEPGSVHPDLQEIVDDARSR